MVEQIIGWFLIIFLGNEWPEVFGPYEEKEDCEAVLEYLDRRGYEPTSYCTLLPLPQAASLLTVPNIPIE